MKKLIVIALAFIASNSCLLKADQPKANTQYDEATVAVKNFLLDLNSFRVSEAWKRFSTHSKADYRRVYTECIGNLTEKSKIDALRERGFYETLDEVKAMSDGDFWDTFVVDQIVKEKEQKPVLWRQEDAQMPQVEICSVAERSGEIFIVVSFQGLERPRIFQLNSPLYMRNEELRLRAIGLLEKNIPKDARSFFVFTAVREANALVLDVPLETINNLRTRYREN